MHFRSPQGRRNAAFRSDEHWSGSLAELGKECCGFHEIGVGETLSHARDNWHETGFGFIAAMMRSEKAREAGCGAQFPCACLLKTRNL